MNFSILRRQRDRPTDLRAGALGRVHDLARRRIEDAVIERLEPDPDILAVHCRFSLDCHHPRQRTSQHSLKSQLPYGLQKTGCPAFAGHDSTLTR